MFQTKVLPAPEVNNISLKLLAHLGDAVFHLYECEREILTTISARHMHDKVVARVKADKQAELLGKLMPELTEKELDIVRRARNLKPAGYRKTGQGTYRKATAFEALVGYLYLLNRERLGDILKKTVENYPSKPLETSNP